MSSTLTAAQFVKKLQARRSPAEAQKSLRYFKSGKGEYGEGDKFIGVRMGDVFNLAKESLEMPLSEIEKLLESQIHEARAGVLSIMGKIARRKKTPAARRKELFDLYMRRHDRVNNWDLVDLGALYVVGIHLLDKPRAILYKLARSKNMWERRTAIVSTGQFIRKGEVGDTFKNRGDAAQRRSGSNSQGNGMDVAHGRSGRSPATAGISRQARRYHAPNTFAVRD
jgi:hypothetical protein